MRIMPGDQQRMANVSRRVGLILWPGCALALLVILYETGSVQGSGPMVFTAGLIALVTGYMGRYTPGMVFGAASLFMCLLLLALTFFLEWSFRESRIPFITGVAAYLLIMIWPTLRIYRAGPIGGDPCRCRKCGYALYGLNRPQCPECGGSVNPRFVPRAPLDGAYAIRRATNGDMPAIITLMLTAVDCIDDGDYDRRQRDTWMAMIKSNPPGKARLADSAAYVTCLAENRAELTGLVAMTREGYIDLLYTHPDHAHKGIASHLLAQAALDASQFGVTALTTHASITARRFFEQRGFTVEYEQTITRDGITLTNHAMRCALA